LNDCGLRTKGACRALNHIHSIWYLVSSSMS
jgi:hypothetical protein